MADPVFRSWNDFLAPSPDANYGSVLPFAYNREGSPSWVTEGSNPRFALPEWLRSAAQGVVGLGESTQTGSLTPEALATLTMGSAGTGATLGVRGALASGASKPPIRAYHGSPHDFERFDISKAGSTTDPGQLGRAIYAATDERVAANKPHRYELNVTPTNPLSLEMPNFFTDKADLIRKALGLPPEADAAMIAEAARKAGHDAAILDYSPTGYMHKEVAAFDPGIIEILRKYALAGGPAPPGFSVAPQQQQPPQAPGFRVAKDMVY